MDYKTFPASRKMLRDLSAIFRKMFEVDVTGSFPVMEALERFGVVFKNSYYHVVEDKELPITVPAKCNVLLNGGFEILIKQSVYDGAYRGIGAYRDHIVHEMSHAFLYSIGFTPIMDRSFSPRELPCFCSSEWQAKALCGEVMMPFDETEDMYSEEIEFEYGVSAAQARFRKKYK